MLLWLLWLLLLWLLPWLLLLLLLWLLLFMAERVSAGSLHRAEVVVC